MGKHSRKAADGMPLAPVNAEPSNVIKISEEVEVGYTAPVSPQHAGAHCLQHLNMDWMPGAPVPCCCMATTKPCVDDSLVEEWNPYG